MFDPGRMSVKRMRLWERFEAVTIVFAVVLSLLATIRGMKWVYDAWRPADCDCGQARPVRSAVR